MHTNRLAQEKSPYLLQHAHNPVEWYAWGEEAFEKARLENKPIFLSIGYSTCHWCHVMERESFENEAIAALMNRDYVAIKVDREERPDVDRIYMTFVQATTGSGGWPMSVWLTPELKPFFGGTYFPPENRWGHPGFGSILTQIAQSWAGDREKIEESARHVVEQLKQQVEVAPTRAGAAFDAGTMESAFSIFRRSFDSRLGGFGGAPKFPRVSVHHFLLRYYARTDNSEALDMVLLTLREMARGGMNDQLGGGFHRYSVDDRWFVPHFEKMLYDQAQIAISYLEAFQATGDRQYAEAARRVFDYVLRDMTDAGGGFYSAEDADSAIAPDHPGLKGEGAFYIWSLEEIHALLSQPAAGWFCYRYGVREGSNVESDPHSGAELGPLGGGLERLDHHTEAEQIVAQGGPREAAVQPGPSRRAPDGKPAVSAQQFEGAAAPVRDLLRAALEADDRQAPLAIAAQAEIRTSELALQPAAAREGHRHARLCPIGEAGDIRERMLARERSQRLHAGGELLEEDALIDALLRRRAHAQRELGDDPEGSLGADEPLADRGGGGRGGSRRQRQLAVGGREAHAEHHLLDRAVARGGLSGGPGGGAAAERDILVGLREVPERESAARQPALERRSAHPGLHGDSGGLLVEADQCAHAAEVESQHAGVLSDR